MLTLEAGPAPPRRMGRVRRTIALIAGLAMFAVSVQASLIEACGYCPTDCPMHAQGQNEHRGSKIADKAKPRCHGAAKVGSSESEQLRRPPCKTSYTLSGSLLPPFTLIEAQATRVQLDAIALSSVPSAARTNHKASLDTPPPISP